MDSTYPQSPDLSGLGRPQSPDLTGLGQPQDLDAIPLPAFGNFAQQTQHYPGAGQNPYAFNQPTSVPTEAYQDFSQPYQYPNPQPLQLDPRAMPGTRRIKNEDDDDFMPDAPNAGSTRRSRGVKQEPAYGVNGSAETWGAPPAQIKSEDLSDPTLGCQLKTSFPVARIKRIMQADEDIGKVAQVTPTVVSRALELFMIKLISAAAHQAIGTSGAATPAASKGPRRVLAQHLKKAVLADEKLDFLTDHVSKVPDAPSKAKKEDSDSEGAPKPKKKGKKRKDSGDDI